MKDNLLVILLLFFCVHFCYSQEGRIRYVGDSIHFCPVLRNGDLSYNSIDNNGLQYKDSKKENYINPVFRIPVHIVTNYGTVIVVSEVKPEALAYEGVNLCIMRSDDSGQSFNQVLKCKGGYANILYDGINEIIYVFKGLEYMKSVDDGISWTNFQKMEINYDNIQTDERWTSLCISPNNGIQLRNGILVLPCILQKGTGRDIFRNSNAIIYSSDFGKSWKFSPVTPRNIIVNEMTVAEYKDNQVMINARGGTELSWSRYNPGRRVFISKGNLNVDREKWNINSWILHESDTSLKEPVCNASFIRCNYKGKIFGLFCNPQSEDGKRKNLTLQISSDFITWHKFANLTPLGKEVYGYCSMNFINGIFSFVYEDIQEGILYADLSGLLDDIVAELYH